MGVNLGSPFLKARVYGLTLSLVSLSLTFNSYLLPGDVLKRYEKSKKLNGMHIIYKDSKLLAPVVYLADQVYGWFGPNNLDRKLGICPDQPGRKQMY